MVEMDLVAVRIELPGNTPVVLLRESESPNRLLPIFIGQPEATAIAFALDGVETPRPMTHDLLQSVLSELNASLDRVVVTALSEGTFYAELHLTAGARPHRISCRPSDAMALAVRVGCPIFVEDAVLDEAALAEPVEVDETSEEVVEQFREFIDNVTPDDFV